MTVGEMKVKEYEGKLVAIVEQLRSCNYGCEAGVLVKNVAFQALENMARAHQNTSEVGDSAAVALLREALKCQPTIGEVVTLQNKIFAFLESQPPCPVGSVNSEYMGKPQITRCKKCGINIPCLCKNCSKGLKIVAHG